MRLALLTTALAAAASLTGCYYAPPPGPVYAGPAYARPGYVAGPSVYYDAYYDGYYGPFVDGYWGPDRAFWFYDVHRGWQRDFNGHFRRNGGGDRFVHVHGTGAYRRR